MSPWTNEQLTRLISLYKNRPVLYDTKNDLYRENERAVALAEIQQIMCGIRMGTTLEEVKKKINYLRTRYCKELKEVNGAGPHKMHKPLYRCFSHLDFLRNHVRPRQSESSLKHMEEKSKRGTSVRPPPKKRKVQSNRESSTELPNNVNSAMWDEIPKDMRMFLQYVGSELVDMDYRVRAVLKNQILELILKAKQAQ